VGDVPLQEPDQPVKIELASGVAVIVTVDPAATSAMHVVSRPVVQLRPAPDTVPVPDPFVLVVMAKAGRKLAVTVLALSIVTVHAFAAGAQPMHATWSSQAPVQLPNTDWPATGVGVSVTLVPSRYVAWQAVPHSMPAGSELTLPGAPLFAAVSAYRGMSANVAVTDFAWSTVTVHGPVPVHAPDQPVKRDSDPTAVLGVAVSVTTMPS
jgi:hypothetical protein